MPHGTMCSSQTSHANFQPNILDSPLAHVLMFRQPACEQPTKSSSKPSQTPLNGVGAFSSTPLKPPFAPLVKLLPSSIASPSWLGSHPPRAREGPEPRRTSATGWLSCHARLWTRTRTTMGRRRRLCRQCAPPRERGGEGRGESMATIGLEQDARSFGRRESVRSPACPSGPMGHREGNQVEGGSANPDFARVRQGVEGTT